jgi:hypothetical protein
MEWTIKIENKPNQRIRIKFDPLKRRLIFNGEYKPHNKEWVVFTKIKHPLWVVESLGLPDEEKEVLITADKIQELIGRIYEELKKIVERYEEVAEGLNAVKVIEVVEEPNE